MFAKKTAWFAIILASLLAPAVPAAGHTPPVLTEALATDQGVELAWNPPLDAHVEGYILYRSTPGSGTTPIPLAADTTSYVDAEVDSPIVTYQVTAIVDGEETLPSNPLAPLGYPHCPQGEPYFWVTAEPPFIDINEACFFPLPP